MAHRLLRTSRALTFGLGVWLAMAPGTPSGAAGIAPAGECAGSEPDPRITQGGDVDVTRRDLLEGPPESPEDDPGDVVGPPSDLFDPRDVAGGPGIRTGGGLGTETDGNLEIPRLDRDPKLPDLDLPDAPGNPGPGTPPLVEPEPPPPMMGPPGDD
ncbi:MAG: hypothetical protein AAF430_04275 [Myxococcota bacterium]